MSLRKAIPLLSIQDSSYHISGLVCSLQGCKFTIKKSLWNFHTMASPHTLQLNKEHIINLSILCHQTSFRSRWIHAVWCYML